MELWFVHRICDDYFNFGCIMLSIFRFASSNNTIFLDNNNTQSEQDKNEFQCYEKPILPSYFYYFLILVPIYFTFYTIIHKHDHVSISRCTIPQCFLYLNRQNKIIIEFVSSSFLCITIKFHCVHRVMQFRALELIDCIVLLIAKILKSLK